MSVTISVDGERALANRVTTQGRRSSLTSGKAGTVSANESNGVESNEIKPVTCDGYLKLLGSAECEKETLTCKLSPNGSVAAVGLSDGSIRIINTETFKCNFHLHDEQTSSTHYPNTSLHFLPPREDQKYDSYLLTTYASGHVKIWLYNGGSAFRSVNEGRQVFASGVSPDASCFVTSGSTDALNVYDMERFCVKQLCQPSNEHDVMDGHRMRVFSIKYHPEQPHVFLSGGWDDTIHFWDDRVEHSVQHFSGAHICGEALDIDAAHQHIITGSWRSDNALQIWDYRSMALIKDVEQSILYHSLLYSASWVGDEDILCGGSNMNMAMLIQRSSLTVSGALVNLPAACYATAHHLIAEKKTAAGLPQFGCLIAAVAGTKVYFCKKLKPLG